MSQNRKVLKTVIIIILITLVICIGVSTVFRIGKPVFLPSYVELELPVFDNGYYGDNQFELRYITNASDTRVVNEIEFIERPELIAYASEYDFGRHIFDIINSNNLPGEIVGMYSLRAVNIHIDAYDIKVSMEDLHLTKAKIHFSDGESLTVDIGEIVILGNHHDSLEHLEFKSSNSSSSIIDNTTFEVKEDITLLKVDGPLLKNIEDLIDIKIDGVDYKDVNGIKYSKGDTLKTSTELKESNDPLLKFDFYNLRPRLYFEDREGNMFTDEFDGFYIKEYNFELLDIIKFLRAKGEI